MARSTNIKYVVFRHVGITTIALADLGEGYEFDEQSENTLICDTREEAQEYLDKYEETHDMDDEPEGAERVIEEI